MQKYHSLKNYLRERNVCLVAVSKKQPNEAIESLYNEGQRVLGENQVQELVQKEATLPKDIEWHMIGHLQSNKVKYIAPFVSMIHSIDSFKLLDTVQKEAVKNNRKINVLLQIHIAEEQSKFGFEGKLLQEQLSDELLTKYSHIVFCGVMGMATFTDNDAQVKAEFSQLKHYFDVLKSTAFLKNSNFKHCSMGMSGDYELAINSGSNMVRIGSLLFGQRKY